MKTLRIVIILAVVFLCACLCAGTAAAAGFGLIPGLDLGIGGPRDLGVTHDEEDLNRAQAKIRQQLVPNTGDPYGQLLDATPMPVDTALTQEEYSAHVEKVHPLEDVQIRFEGDTFELSGRIIRNRIPGLVLALGIQASDAEILEIADQYLPVDPIIYLAGTGSATNGDVSLDLSDIQLGYLPIPLPPDVAEGYLESYLELIITQIPALNAESVYLQDGELVYEGTIPSVLPNY